MLVTSYAPRRTLMALLGLCLAALIAAVVLSSAHVEWREYSNRTPIPITGTTTSIPETLKHPS